MSARADMAAQAAALKADGLNGVEIGIRLGISRSYAYELLSDPEGVKSRARKPSGTCKNCGGPTTYLKGGVANYCRACRADAYRVWTKDAVIDAIQTFTARYGTPPRAVDWNPAQARSVGAPDDADRFYKDGCWPAYKTVWDVFGTWNAAIEAAGLTPCGPGHYRLNPRPGDLAVAA